ncbi:hypothetical protein N7509_003547 [Penicillium cosmopolitanum]|uniref:Uncharacterized protein n=1 Tax=Penicillium cosmopolitanum TaxID=1131564 RepID=A0A9X0BBG2_9EURO|nr:uncharacterized protein N7509_003547 [Penicillium cosmopolitanum]KAJ5403676.1 hypothetical protein N7509_003547 [Penicillium cosmopolitanum]
MAELDGLPTTTPTPDLDDLLPFHLHILGSLFALFSATRHHISQPSAPPYCRKGETACDGDGWAASNQRFQRPGPSDHRGHSNQ